MERTKRNFVEIEAENSAENNLVSTGLKRGRSRQCAFTMNELLIVLALVGILLIVLPRAARAKVHVNRIQCVNNLRNIGLGFRIFAADYNDRFPMLVSTNEGGVLEFMNHVSNTFRVFQAMSNELTTPKILRCPKDVRQSAPNMSTVRNMNVSYFVGMDATEREPAMILTGDRNLQVKVATNSDGILCLSTNDFIGWRKEMHWSNRVPEKIFFGQITRYKTVYRDEGHIVRADGSADVLSSLELQKTLQTSRLATNRFMLPD